MRLMGSSVELIGDDGSKLLEAADAGVSSGDESVSGAFIGGPELVGIQNFFPLYYDRNYF